MERTLETASPDETFALGKRLGAALRPRDFVGLAGQLGAGKTLFARGVADGAGVPLDLVSSPTYSIVQSYKGRVTLHHADLYRLTSEDDLYATGYFDLLETDGAWLVEWIDHVASAAPADALRVSLEVLEPERRRLSVTSSGPASEALLVRWLGQPRA
ncbi:MAG: tRNA (adenosine(37)-N6)-threonylcarbamoyltransferase complex ATPase subunit type 1 TsaE [Myxococcota bacterium]